MMLLMDIGGTHMRLALIRGQAVADPRKFKNSILRLAVLDVANRYEEDLKAILAQVVAWKELPELQNPDERISMAVIGIAGSLNHEASALLNAVNLKTWEGHGLKAELEQMLGCDVMLLNDTYCAAMAEAMSLGQPEPFWYVNWGTGIGGCLVEPLDHKKWSIRPSEIGHMTIASTGAKCRCGQTDCWDTLVSGRALLEKYARSLDRLSDHEWQQALDLFVIGLQDLFLAVPVRRCIVNGGVIEHHHEFVDELNRRIQQNVKIMQPDFEVQLAALGGLAGIAGAYFLGQGSENPGNF